VALSVDYPFPFKKMTLLPYDQFSGAMNMALDFLFSKEMKSESFPILRFYGWCPYAISLGRNQNTHIVKKKKLYEDGYHLVRRPTGGSAIFHSEELTYSMIIPVGYMTHRALYETIHRIFYNVLQNLGYRVRLQTNSQKDNYLKESKKSFACFNRAAYSELRYHDKKIMGSAQRRYPNAILQHGSLLIGKKQLKIINYLDDSPENLKQHLQKLKNSSTCLNDHTVSGIDETVIINHFINQLKETFQIEVEEYQQGSELFNKAEEIKNQFII
jgi:lipoate-protein ligase A